MILFVDFWTQLLITNLPLFPLKAIVAQFSDVQCLQIRQKGAQDSKFAIGTLISKRDSSNFSTGILGRLTLNLSVDKAVLSPLASKLSPIPSTTSHFKVDKITVTYSVDGKLLGTDAHFI